MALLMIFTVPFCAGLTVFAADDVLLSVEKGEDGQLVVDMAGILTDDEISDLTEKALAVGEKHDCDVVFVTTLSVGSKSTMEYADDYYDYHGYKSDGVLVLITLDNGYGGRGVWISTTGNCIKDFSESEQEKVTDSVFNMLSSGNYYGAFLGYAEGIDRYLSPYVPAYMILVALLIGFLIALIISLVLKGQLKSVKNATGAANYIRAGSMKVTSSRDSFLYATVSKTAIPKDSGSSGGSHTGSSGTSHGGSGRSF